MKRLFRKEVKLPLLAAVIVYMSKVQNNLQLELEVQNNPQLELIRARLIRINKWI